MSFRIQIKSLVKKNYIELYRSREIFIENLVPIIISIMLALKRKKMNYFNQI